MSKASDKINVLVIGSGGREHALGWKIKQSKRCGTLYFAPGNGGTAGLGQSVDLPADPVNTKNADAIDYFCRQNDVSLIVVGPENPLCGGLVDRLAKPGRWVFGPNQAAAKLEADKAYAKQIMKAGRIPTADAKVFTDMSAAIAYCEARETPVVVKATGLAKGKGAIVCDTVEESVAAVRLCMEERAFDEAGDTILIEERLVGQEVSILALVDGQNIYVLDPSQDHKQVHEGDTGPNTGGMGAYCPTPLVDDAQMDLIQREVLVPTVDALRRSDIDFKGVLYAGLFLTAGGPKVLEYNVRFGDPECQPLMMRMKGDLVDIMIATCEGRLDEVEMDWDQRVCCCVVMASGGYPGDYETGVEIKGIADAEADSGGDVKVFHAGTKKGKDGNLVTAGGRVLNVCAVADTLKEAQAKANAACDKISFAGSQFRRDIGSRVM